MVSTLTADLYSACNGMMKTKRSTWLILVAIIIVAAGVALNQPSATESAEEDRSSIIRGTAMEAVRSRLKDSSGAKFDMQSIGWNYRKDGAAEITGNVRAQNGFGAVLDSKWHVVMREIPGDKWELVWISIDGKSNGDYPDDLSL